MTSTHKPAADAHVGADGVGAASRVSAPGLVRGALAAALIAGLIESLCHQFPRVRGDIVFADADVWWITPLSYAIFLVPWAMLLAAGQRMVRRPVGTEITVALLLLPATLGLAWMLYPRIHRLAILALAIGLAVQTGRLAAASPGRYHAAIRGVVQWIGGLTVMTGLGLHVASFAGERWRLSHLPAPSGSPPNVVLLILDTVRAKSLSLYGYAKATTPHLVAIASRSTLFRYAYSVSPWTLPAHASMFTGRYPYELSTDWTRPLDDAPKTLAEVLGQAGYRTAGFVGNIEYTGAHTGLSRGFAHYEDWPLSAGRIIEGSSLATFVLNNPRVRALLGHYEAFTAKNGERIAQDFLTWVDGSKSSQRPFFAFLNFLDAHEPYFVPAPYEERFGKRENRGLGLIYPRYAVAKRALDEKLSGAELAAEERAYEGSIAYLDHVVASLLDSLDSRGILDSTLIIISSDHGELFGEFGFTRHGNTLYPQSLHVPLLMRYPAAVPAGRVVDDAVSVRDLAATILDLAGVRDASLPGYSLARTWRTDRAAEGATHAASPLLSELWSAPNQPAWFPVSAGYMRSMVGWPDQLIVKGDGSREIVSLHSDTVLAPPGARTDSVVKVLQAQVARVPRTTFPGRDRARSLQATVTPPQRP